MKTEAQKFDEKATQYFAESYAFLRDILAFVQENGQHAPLPDLVDMGFFLREFSDKMDELRKETNARLELIGKLIAMRRSMEVMVDDSLSLSIRGEFATGIPEVKRRPITPKPGTPQFRKLMEFLGIDPDAEGASALTFHYTRLGDLITRRIESGHDIPPEIVTSTPVYTTEYRRKHVKAKRNDDGHHEG